VANHQFYLGTRDFISAHGKAIDVLLAQIAELDSWANGNTDAVADQLAASVGIPAPILKVALARQTFCVTTISDKVVAGQQEIADAVVKIG
jgi:sulfonate transport system substrate-binding protein